MKKLIILFFSIIMCYCGVHSIAGADTLKGEDITDAHIDGVARFIMIKQF